MRKQPSASQLELIAGLSGETGFPDESVLRRATYQLVLGLVALNALVVTVAYYFFPPSSPVRQVLYILDWINATIFFLDFLLRLRMANSKMHYLVASWGWLDLLGSLPGFPLMRLIRIARILAATSRLRRTLPSDVRVVIRRRLAESTLLLGSWAALTVMTFCSIAVLIVEAGAPDANILTGSDAIWWSIVTMATVGYGDRYPVTSWGRIVGSIEIIMGVGIFSVLTSYVASTFLRRSSAVERLGATTAADEEVVQLRAAVRELLNRLENKEKEQQTCQGASQPGSEGG
jgi:voltage-gated potassium channel